MSALHTETTGKSCKMSEHLIYWAVSHHKDVTLTDLFSVSVSEQG